MIGQRTGTVAGAGAATLTSTAFAGLGDVVGRTVLIQSGAGMGQSRRVTAYDAATGTATLDVPWLTGPANGDTFVIRGIGEFNGLALPNVAVRLVDSDAAGVVITPLGDLPGAEGRLATYTVELTRAPRVGETVEITLIGTLRPARDRRPDHAHVHQRRPAEPDRDRPPARRRRRRGLPLRLRQPRRREQRRRRRARTARHRPLRRARRRAGVRRRRPARLSRAHRRAAPAPGSSATSRPTAAARWSSRRSGTSGPTAPAGT